MTYINIRTVPWGIETIDEFETHKEARENVKEYRLAYQGTGISPYLSQRSTKEWKESS